MHIEPRILDFVALGIFVVVAIFLVYLVIFIHDIPYEIAKKRNHPHQEAIHAAGWVSLFLMHTIWPFLWIWAYLYNPKEGWGVEKVAVEPSEEFREQLKKLERLEQKVAQLESELEAKEAKAESKEV
ncbi:MAG TPA: DUF3302 domain-containing protein [Desulfobacteraceae bacterium]|nr:DUF3302 domain-containing protein [Desulfobacteraceae bacterium]